jgi:hypothetical protein
MTFHIRLVSPANLTEHLVDVLLADSGVSNVVVLTGSARRPDGDAVQFDVLARSANSVLRHLETFADDRPGSITVDSVDAAIGEQVPRHPRTASCSATLPRYGMSSKPKFAPLPFTRPVSTSCWP